MSERSARPEGFVPSYKAAQVATRGKFLDLIDSRPPFLYPELYPQPDDYKAGKFQFQFTQSSDTAPSLFFRHSVDEAKLLLLLSQMRAAAGNGAHGSLLGFPEFKGSPDRRFPQWEVTSRQMDVKQQEMNLGLCYVFTFTQGQGAKQANGIVTPVKGSPGEQRGSMVLPILGSERLPPLALMFAEKASAYMTARETDRLAAMRTTITRLDQLARRGDAESATRISQVFDHLYSD